MCWLLYEMCLNSRERAETAEKCADMNKECWTVDEGVEAAEKCAENCMKYVETTKDVLKQQKNVLRILWLRYVF